MTFDPHDLNNPLIQCATDTRDACDPRDPSEFDLYEPLMLTHCTTDPHKLSEFRDLTCMTH